MTIFKFETEAEWLAQRSKDITSTEVAALLGISTYKSRFRLWQEKAGHIESDFEDSPHTRWGRRLQNTIALGICEDNGWQCNDLTLYYVQHPSLRLGASMDQKILCPKRGVGLMEVKSTSYFSEEMGWGKADGPLEYETQLQTQLDLAFKNGSTFDFGVLAALDGRKTTKLYFRGHEKKFGEVLEREVDSFWESIEKDQPPAPDYLVDEPIIHALMPKTRAGEGKNLSNDQKAKDLIAMWSDAEREIATFRPEIKRLENIKKACKNQLLEMVGNAEFVTIGNIRITTRESETEDTVKYSTKTRRFDVRKLK